MLRESSSTPLPNTRAGTSPGSHTLCRPPSLLKLVELLDSVQDGLLGRLLHLAREKELVEDHVDLRRTARRAAHAPFAAQLEAGRAREAAGERGRPRCSGVEPKDRERAGRRYAAAATAARRDGDGDGAQAAAAHAPC